MKTIVTMKALCRLLLLLTFTDSVVYSLSDSVCKSSLWGGITESMIKTSNPAARDVMNSKLDCCPGRDIGGWCGDTHRSSEHWIEVDFTQGVGIRGIVIQKPENEQQGYVTSISIELMLKGSTSWQYFSSDPHTPQAMTGLSQSVGTTTVSLTPGIAVSKIKINILNYQKSPCLRFDLLGCTNYEVLCPNGCLNGGKCIAENNCACSNNYRGSRCETRISQTVCHSALGLASGSITDSMIAASSSTAGKPKQKVRYNCCIGEDNGAWCPLSTDPHPWLEVTLAKPMAVSGLNFQHPSQKDSQTYPSKFMTTFQLKFISALDPLREWRNFNEHIPSIYNSTLSYNIGLNTYIVTDAIRIYPDTYTTAPCFRMEVTGCDPTILCPKDFCQNGGTCMGFDVCKCLKGFYGNSCDQTASTMVHLTFGFTKIIEHVIHTTANINFNVHGTVTLVTNQNGNGISLTGNSYVTVDNTGFNACLKHIDTCSSGFTLTINVKLQQLTDNTYIISSGGDLQNHKGIALFYTNHQLHFVVTTTSQQWVVDIKNTLSLNVWHKIELSWSKTLGASLFIDNNLAGSVTQTQTVVATQVKPLTIGFGYHHHVPISMTVNGLQTFDSRRENLIVNGLVTTPAPTPAQQVSTSYPATNTTSKPTTVAATTQALSTTSNPTTTPSCDQQTLDFSFSKIQDNILITPSYYFTVYGNATLTPQQNGKAILELHKHGHYAELPNYGLECIQDMTKCENGFTLSAEIKLLDLNSTDKRYIFSSGGDQVGASGLAIYLWHGDLYCATKKDNFMWMAKRKLDVKAGEWHTYQVSWNKKDGFIVYLDEREFLSHSVKLPNPDQPTIYPLYIANAPNTTYSSTLIDVRNLFTWSASRDSLIGQGCITEYSTVPRTTKTTTKTTVVQGATTSTPTRTSTKSSTTVDVKIPASQTVYVQPMTELAVATSHSPPSNYESVPPTVIR